MKFQTLLVAESRKETEAVDYANMFVLDDSSSPFAGFKISQEMENAIRHAIATAYLNGRSDLSSQIIVWAGQNSVEDLHNYIKRKMSEPPFQEAYQQNMLYHTAQILGKISQINQ